MLFLAATIIPLPLPLSRVTGSERHTQNARVSEQIEKAEALSAVPSGLKWYSMSRNRAGSLRGMLLAVAMFSSMALASTFSASMRRKYLMLLAVVAVAIGMAGFVGKWIIPQGSTLWWVYPIRHGRRSAPMAVACFINRNHFAGFLSLLAPATAALFAHESRGRWWRGLPWLAAMILLTTIILGSLSRGGLVACGAGLAVAVFVLLWQRRFVAAIIIMLMPVGAVSAVKFAPRVVQERIATLRNVSTTSSFQTRLVAWRDTGRMLTAYPVTGVGLNGLQMAFSQHRSTSERAHMEYIANEYVQLPSELGVVGTALGLVLLGGVAAQAFSSVRRGAVHPVVTCAAVGGLAAAAVHAGVDLCPRVPLYAVTMSSLAGLLVCSPPGRAPERSLSGRRAHLLSTAVVMVLAPLMFTVGRLDSHVYLSRASASGLKRALVWAPTSWYTWAHLGDRLVVEGGEAERVGLEYISQAAEYDPNNYRLWIYLGEQLLRVKEYKRARAAFVRVHELRHWIQVPDIPEE